MSSAFTSMGHFLPPCGSQPYGPALVHSAATK